MPFEQTITIINNSGKIISTGKHLVNIFKDAKAAYQEKKAALKSERMGGMRRAQTFDVSRDIHYEEYDEYDEYDDQDRHYHERRLLDGPRRSQDDFDRRSHASSRSHRSRRSHRSSRHHHRSSRPALTESNLRTLSEVSSTAPSAAPVTYRSPYAETAPRDMALSRPTLHPAAAMHPSPANQMMVHSPQDTGTVAAPSPRDSLVVARPRSDPSLRQRRSLDQHLAYGNIPPDLASRTDLDKHSRSSSSTLPREGEEEEEQEEAKTLMHRIESLLSEAQCLHHTAATIITQLQSNPEAAAAVALTLAELSTLLAKMSPAFLSVVKGGSPAVFALLASPQFLIGTGIAVGVTVVMFGGWRIIKRIRESKKEAVPVEAMEMQPTQQPNAAAAPGGGGGPGQAGFARGAGFGAGGGSANGFEEALVLEDDDDLSTIETWRRGIAPFGEDESVDIELISPEAMRSRVDDARSVRTGRSHRTHRSHHSHRSHRSHRSRRHGDGGDDDAAEHEVPERKSSKGFGDRDRDRDRDRDHDRDRERERDRDRNDADDGRSEASSRRSHRSKGKSRVEVKAIEDGSRQRDESVVDFVFRPKEKKSGNMLKQLFKKKKDKDERTEISVMV